MSAEAFYKHCQKTWIGWPHPSLYRMRPSDSNLGARHRVNRSLIQTQRPGRLATEFESVSDSLGGARPSLNWMAASNINSDAAIRARFSGSEGIGGMRVLIDIGGILWSSQLGWFGRKESISDRDASHDGNILFLKDFGKAVKLN
ncbi:hypothetical protein PCASD_02908 [Puccinia coronata f. sp. avenae]|uniref:Uncharacterized protein n=1 Tax=Puccinia coronata f. sp. avenae TaxID=200324 RepID=A0A2N5VEQ5_9BASI|nr:hypothetical protein PCASD_02908 [Puccinia coronata f. sp. avenae]